MQFLQWIYGAITYTFIAYSLLSSRSVSVEFKLEPLIHSWLYYPPTSRYVSLEEKKKSGAKRQNEVLIHRKRKHPSHPDQTLSVPYRIIDSHLRLAAGDWYARCLLPK